jgi:hypothetical protein
MWPGCRDSSSVAFSWWPPREGAPDSYNVYRDGHLLYKGVLADSKVGGGSKPQGWYCDINLPPSATHSYYVTAVTGGIESQPSSSITMTTLAGKSTPTTLPAAVTDPTTWILPYSLPAGTVWKATSTSNNNATGTRTGNIVDACGFQYALTNAQPNDIIVLTAGATYIAGNKGWQVPAYAGPSWVYVISSEDPGYKSGGTLPAYSYSAKPGGGNYVTPANAATMPTVQFSYGNEGVGLEIAAAAKNIRFVGLNIHATPGIAQQQVYFCVMFTNSKYGNFRPSADHIYFDRCLIGMDTATLGSGFVYCAHGIGAVNCNHFLVHQCHIYGIATNPGTGGDANAIYAIGGGPHCIQNSYLEAVAEGVIYGGAFVDQNQIPHDVTYRYNYNTKLAAWQALPAFGKFVKNHFELKCAQRVDCYGNIHQNNWSAAGSQGQHGRSFAIGSKDQQQLAVKATIWETCPWVCVTDVNIHDNLIYDVNCGVAFFMADNSASGHTSTLRVANNHIYINPAYGGDWMRAISCGGTCTDMTIDHNTIIINMASRNNYGAQASIFNIAFGMAPGAYGNPKPYTPNPLSRAADRATITNNIFDGAQAVIVDAASWAAAWGPNFTWKSNLTIQDAASYPGTTYSQVAYTSIGFANWRGNTEKPASPNDWNVKSGKYATASTTGGRIGATL